MKETESNERSTGAKKWKSHDAHNAETKSQGCTLIVTEGDSALNLAMVGLSVIGRENYGIFPLRGKIINVKEALANAKQKNSKQKNSKNKNSKKKKIDKIYNDKVLVELMRILGLKREMDYKDTKELRYGRIMIMTDMDHDGCHIKGLIINLFHSLWPSLLKLNPSFLVEFVTPFVKATHKTIGLLQTFHSNSVYEDWKKSLGNEAIQWSTKYYKGLGRISTKDGKKLFSDVDAHTKALYWSSAEDGLALERAFGKENAEDRKIWLQNLPEEAHLDRTGPRISIRDFINLELVFFLRANLKRSIPLMLDGLKPSNRKVLCTLFNNNQKFTVEQLASEVSKSCGYHHGQESLEKTIIRMAQDFVGSPNNINILEPDGQFGSRYSGGTDASNPKYISTNLSAMARVLFPKDEDFHLKCLVDDGKYIEPSNYLPVIPTILVNGAKGIGSAWSTFVPKYNPREIVENIRRFLNGGERMRTMDPWYRNFKGTIEKVKPKEGASEEGPCTYKLSGVFKKINETTIVITELPIGKWTRKYLRFLQDLKEKDLIQGFKNDSDDESINITITLTKEKMKEVSHKGIQKTFKLSTVISTGNMNLLQTAVSGYLIKRYNTPEQILEDFAVTRLQAYEERRNEMLEKLTPEVRKMEDKLAFIRGLLSGEIQMNANIIRTLEEKKFVPFPHDAPGNYQYLFEGLMEMMTDAAKLEELERERDAMQKVVVSLEKHTSRSLWLKELDFLIEKLNELYPEESKAEKERRGTLEASNSARDIMESSRKSKEQVKHDGTDVESQKKKRIRSPRITEKDVVKRRVHDNEANDTRLKASAASPAKEGQVAEEGEANYVLEKTQLEAIDSDSEIREAPKGEALQKLIGTIDSSSNPLQELDEAKGV